MSEFVKNLISDLHSNDAALVQEALLQASFIFEKRRGVGANYDIEERISNLCWSRSVAATHFSESDIDALKSAVINFIEREPASNQVASALSALSQLWNASLKPVFVKALRTFLDTDSETLYTAMIGLHDIGEDVFAGRRSMGITMTEENNRLAHEYLKRLDKVEKKS